MQQRALWGYAHGRDDRWEAICVDLDISVQGESWDEVKALLDEAVRTYVEDALRESPADRDRLLHRQAPLLERVRLAVLFMVHIVSSRRRRRDLQASFDIPCPA